VPAPRQLVFRQRTFGFSLFLLFPPPFPFYFPLFPVSGEAFSARAVPGLSTGAPFSPGRSGPTGAPHSGAPGVPLHSIIPHGVADAAPAVMSALREGGANPGDRRHRRARRQTKTHDRSKSTIPSSLRFTVIPQKSAAGYSIGLATLERKRDVALFGPAKPHPRFKASDPGAILGGRRLCLYQDSPPTG